MNSKNGQEFPQSFDWSMWKDVRGNWCAFMVPMVLWAWGLPVTEFCLFMVMAAVLVLIAIYDMRYGLIYDRLVLLLLLLSTISLLFGHLAWETACAGALLGAGLLEGLRVLSGGGLGMGDVKLSVPLGMWLGWEDLLLCLLLASVAGLLYGAWLLACRRLNRQTPLPFGPFLALGALAAFGWGVEIRAYVEVLLCS
ncbi:A24 family peptidase [Selenomonas ruminantium]|uniref:prepilin peptidase n=1 Tax=Selenomonas ruminantium TaxID=971 RepID=UPI0026EDB302|nr:A24 family peptidase [Selenomonas ruminantium]